MRKFLLFWLGIILTISNGQINARPGWFELQTNGKVQESVIGMEEWLDAPAGKYGYMKMKGNRLVFENGKEIKIWGVNLADSRIFVEQEEAENWAAYLAKYGVNGVRLHKFTRPSYMLTGKSTLLHPGHQDKIDYLCHQLREKGIYYGWSHIYGHAPQPGDSTRLLAYDEIINAGGGHLKGTTIGLVHFSEDLQDLSIELTVNMLNHINPYTGLSYAKDPALNFVELQNEDNAFFATTENFLMSAPTYKEIACRKFSLWLRNKYGSHEELVKAWGKEGIDAFPKNQTGEHLDKENIFPMANHALLSTPYIYQPAIRKRLLDTARFLYEMQAAFYERYADAIRRTGYEGEIIASCWQAGDNVGHYYNLYSDYRIGMIDRHNYFGGGAGGHSIQTGKVNNESMLSQPGSGLLSVGMQAVEDRPFSYSEWFAMPPNEWIAEAAPLIATYGMGLQGWAASYAYACNSSHLSDSMEAGNHGVYNADMPAHIGLYPALARMIYSDSLQEGENIGFYSIHPPSLEEGKTGGEVTILQDWDKKEIQGIIPPEALAVGKCGVRFVSSFEETCIPELTSYIDTVQKIIHSTTGQLTWKYGDKPFFTVNTPTARMWVGFTPFSGQESDGYSVHCVNPFAVISVNTLTKEENINNYSSLLITTLGRTRNSGMIYNEDGTELIHKGNSPLLLEGVKATLTFPEAIQGKLHILNHDGERTGNSIPVNGNSVFLDGTVHQTFYYELERID